MNILVTGGAGYIGTHTIIELIANNHSVIAADNLINSSREALRRVEEITDTAIPFYKIDICDYDSLANIFKERSIDAVIHFAGLKAVGESTEKPLLYYKNNIDSTLNLLRVMKEYDVTRLVFSSSATVYGSASIPYSESSQAGIGITNPYSRTKYIIEEIMADIAAADNTCKFTVLRYFNPVGAHPSGRIGEQPNGVPNNLMPYITQVAIGKRDQLNVFGGDYETLDGTAMRDYIHVDDLASGHLAALNNSKPGFHVYNLGSGIGTSVLQLIDAFEKTSGKQIPYKIVERRAGDIAQFYADPALAESELGWKTKRTIVDACQDSWRWQSNNPNGY